MISEDIYILQQYNTTPLLYDNKLIYYRFYVITILEYPNKKSYSIYHNNSILLGNNNHTIDNWNDLCFEHIYPTSFEYYFGHETFINQIVPKSKKLINSIINPILNLIDNENENRWPYYHVFTIDISFTINIEPKLEDISELYKDKLYNKCDIKNDSEKIFLNNLDKYIKDIVFKKKKLEHFTIESKNETIENFTTEIKNKTIENNIIENFDISKINSHKSPEFKKFTFTREYKNYKLLFSALIILFILIIIFKLYNSNKPV